VPGVSPFKDDIAGRPVKGSTVPVHGDVLRWNGTNTPAVWEAGALAYNRATSLVQVLNTVIQTQVYSATVAANDMQTNRTIILELYGDYQNNTGAGRTLNITAVFGSNTLMNATSGNITANASYRPFLFRLVLMNRGATNSQWCTISALLGIPAGGAYDGSATEHWRWEQTDLGTIDTTAAQSLNVSVTHSNNDTDFRLYAGLAVLL